MLQKVIKILSVGLLVFALVCPVFGQSITINGKVQDQNTKEPLIYATVTIEGKPIGVVSNSIGEFTFHIPSDMLDETLTISMLGYSNFSRTVRDVIDNIGTELIIELEPYDILLDEIVILDSLNGGEIFQIAMERVEINYPMDPYLMNAFYRDIKKVDGKYRSLLEAAIKIYDKNYEEPKNPDRLRERVELVEVRKSLQYGDYPHLFDQFNLLEEFFFENNIKYRTFDTRQEFISNMQRGETDIYNERPVYQVYLLGDNNYVLMMYIDVETYGIVQLRFQYGTEKDPIQSVERKGLTEDIILKKKFLEFRDIDGKLYLNFMRASTMAKWLDSETNEVLNYTELVQEMLVNDIDYSDPEWISSSKKMRGYGLQYQDMPYNEDFWENYNVLKNSPIDEQVLKDLEELGKLEEQFKNNN